MTASAKNARTDTMIEAMPLRLWPGVIIVAVQWFLRFVLPQIAPDALPIGVMGGLGGGLLILIWWVFFSRASKADRWGGLVLIIVAMAVFSRLTHVSVSTGFLGMMFFIYTIPFFGLGLVLWAVSCGKQPQALRRATLIAAILISCGGLTLVKTAGFSADGNSDFSWRWAETAEDRLLTLAEEETTLAPSFETVEDGPVWPGFRGENRDNILHNLRIETDWSTHPPVELWRRAVGPGWSSFSVHGNRFFTQEQRGEEEMVSCYNATTGQPVWKHSDSARFWESNAGAGPRGTPTLSGNAVYSLGGTGIVNALNISDGSLIWTRNAASDTGAKLPGWAFSGSPLVVDDLVIVAASGALIAYDAQTGDLRWKGPAGGEAYCSPHLAIIQGTPQILHLSGDGISSVSPTDGTVLWDHAWSGYPIVQPALTSEGDVLFSAERASGMRRLSLTTDSEGWKVEERWTSTRMKPYFNDFAIHKDHVYGFDGSIMACMDLADGGRKWKGGRYGNGQFLLLADQDLLLVLTEQGELALVKAIPDQFMEVARVPAIEGRTWNHPVLAGDILLVRNDKEMAAFRLPLASK